MAQGKVNKPSEVVERNLRLTGEIMRYLLNNSQVFNSLPNNSRAKPPAMLGRMAKAML